MCNYVGNNGYDRNDVAKMCLVSMTKALRPIIVSFSRFAKGHVNEYIASNMIANILGLGWAATHGTSYEGKKTTQQGNSQYDMCTLIVNVLLSTNSCEHCIYRSQYGSVNPAEILTAAIAATSISTLAGVIFAVTARKISKGINGHH